jgi:hypothetical protein
MDKWEYKTLKLSTKGFLGGKIDIEDFEESMNKLGRDGWELVSCFDTSIYQGGSRDVYGVFKKRVNF